MLYLIRAVFYVFLDLHSRYRALLLNDCEQVYKCLPQPTEPMIPMKPNEPIRTFCLILNL